MFETVEDIQTSVLILGLLWCQLLIVFSYQTSSNIAYMPGADTLELVDGVVELGLHGCGPRDARRRSEKVRG